ncbi:uncharacterized protein LOC144288978 [Canis aureus]
MLIISCSCTVEEQEANKRDITDLQLSKNKRNKCWDKDSRARILFRRVQVRTINSCAQSPSVAPISLSVKAEVLPMSKKILHARAVSFPDCCSICTDLPAAPQTCSAP